MIALNRNLRLRSKFINAGYIYRDSLNQEGFVINLSVCHDRQLINATLSFPNLLRFFNPLLEIEGIDYK